MLRSDSMQLPFQVYDFNPDIILVGAYAKLKLRLYLDVFELIGAYYFFL